MLREHALARYIAWLVVFWARSGWFLRIFENRVILGSSKSSYTIIQYLISIELGIGST